MNKAVEGTTPWAVICKAHGQVFLTEAQYEAQLDAMDDLWHCPICHEPAEWDDDNYEQAMGAYL